MPCMARRWPEGKPRGCRSGHKNISVDTENLWTPIWWRFGCYEIEVRKNARIFGNATIFSVVGQVKITMFDYIKEMLEDFHKFDPNKTISRTPAPDNLFKVRYDQPKLDEQKAQIFHTFTAKALFATKRARPDIHTSVAFLTTRVICPALLVL